MLVSGLNGFPLSVYKSVTKERDKQLLKKIVKYCNVGTNIVVGWSTYCKLTKCPILGLCPTYYANYLEHDLSLTKFYNLFVFQKILLFLMANSWKTILKCTQLVPLIMCK